MILMPILALMIRFEGVLPDKELTALLGWLPIFVVISLAVFVAYGIYHRIWHYARVRDLIAIVGAVSLSVAMMFVVDILWECIYHGVYMSLLGCSPLAVLV